MRETKPNASLHHTSKKRSILYWVIAACIAVLGAAAAGPMMSRVEQPEYKVVSGEGSIEIRAYGPMIAAETQVAGQRDIAIAKGFRLLAAYIFGANKPNAKIAMTAPVEQQRQPAMAMTAPVSEQIEGTTWTVRFIMPRGWALETLPVPSDPRVSLKPVPAKRMLTIRFSGLASDIQILAKTDALRDFASKHRLTTVGEPSLAFYNPPWTLPFFRRNEIMLELDDASGSHGS